MKRFYQSIALVAKDDEFNSVLSQMSDDDITTIVKSDTLIMAHGKNLYEGFNFTKEADVSYRMRLLGRLVRQVRLGTNQMQLSLTDCVNPSTMFDCINRGHTKDVPDSAR